MSDGVLGPDDAVDIEELGAEDLDADDLDDDLAAAVIAALVVRPATLAVAESLTGGLVCAALTDVPGASAVVRGGIVAYATELKTDLLGVSPVLLRSAGPVHPVVASTMAREVMSAALTCGRYRAAAAPSSALL